MYLDYDDLARILREIDEKDDVIVTVLQGIILQLCAPIHVLNSFLATGKWFCAYVSMLTVDSPDIDGVPGVQVSSPTIQRRFKQALVVSGDL